MIVPMSFLLFSVLISCTLMTSFAREDVWVNVQCNQTYRPRFCNFTMNDFMTVDDFDRCGPARLELNARNYFLAAAGRKTTYEDNKNAYDRIRLQPKMLRDVSNNSIETTVLGLKVDFPIGLSPVAFQRLILSEGEKATVAGLSPMRTIMILSSLATTKIKDVVDAVIFNGNTIHLWMQVYIFQNRSITIDLIRQAEKNGFKGIVFTADSPVPATVSCDGHVNIHFPPGVKAENVDFTKLALDPSLTFRDITWLKGITRLPIIVKGLLSAGDAIRAIMAGATAIYVSNHGGRQLDGDLASIDALAPVVDAMNSLIPRREVYVDGGVRSGHDVYKALAMGARMVFVGRPYIWGLAMGGSEGVKKVVTILKSGLNETMLITGVAKVSDIGRDTLVLPESLKKYSATPLSSGNEPRNSNSN